MNHFPIFLPDVATWEIPERTKMSHKICSFLQDVLMKIIMITVPVDTSLPETRLTAASTLPFKSDTPYVSTYAPENVLGSQCVREMHFRPFRDELTAGYRIKKKREKNGNSNKVKRHKTFNYTYICTQYYA